ncbi:ABC transporter permease [candidate division KSB1 bacterium]|nr:ABC transporter permease [candidate division KSB1 bacterium]
MLKNYLKIALRNLVRQKLYTFIIVFGLALGVACCLLILLFVEHEWSFDKFHAKQDRLFRAILAEHKTDGGVQHQAYQPMPLAPTLADEFPEIERGMRVFTGGGSVSYEDKHFAESFIFVDPAFFEIFSFPLLQGDPVKVLAEPNGIVLTQRMAEKYFGEEEAIGKQLLTKNWRGQVEVIVTGIAENPPDNSSLQFDFVMHITKHPNYERNLTRWTNFNGSVYVLLKDGAARETLESKFPAFVTAHWGDMRKREQERGAIAKREDALQLRLQPLTAMHLDTSVGSAHEPVSNPMYAMILAGIAILVLAIACINFITLALGRSTSRAREVGMRKVLGAFRRQLVRQFGGEALLLSALALVLGLVLAELFLPVFRQFTQKELALQQLFGGWALLAVLGLLPLIGLLAGGYPAAFISRFQPATVLKGGLKLRQKTFFTRALVVFQFGLAIFLIVCAIFITRQQQFIASRNLGYNPEHVIAINSFGGASGDGSQKMLRLREALAAYPQQVLSVTGTSAAFNKGWDLNSFDHEGVERSAFIFGVDYDYLDMLGIKLVSGRNFSRELQSDLINSVIVNENFVREYGWQEPIIGRRLSGWNDEKIPGGPTVIGVVQDYHFLSLHRRIQPAVLLMDPDFGINDILVRVSATHIPATIKLIEEKWRTLAPNTPFDFTFVNEDLQRQYETDQRWQKIISYSTVFAVLLAGLGLFGLATLAATSRTKEIGIRKVLGASVARVVTLLSREFAILVLLANLVAWPLAYFTVGKVLQNYAYRIDMSWWVFTLAGGMALLIALLTVSLQALKAALANPVEALRYE